MARTAVWVDIVSLYTVRVSPICSPCIVGPTPFPLLFNLRKFLQDHQKTSLSSYDEFDPYHVIRVRTLKYASASDLAVRKDSLTVSTM